MKMSINTSEHNLDIRIPWALTIAVTLLAFSVWGNSFGWNLSALNAYVFFPLLGLMGFSIMWSHYMTGELQRLMRTDTNLDNYFRLTGYAVLVAIVFHPGILIYKRFRDGYGLPPGSYQSFVAPGMAWATMLGTVCLFIFLSFEFHRFFAEKRWWPFVVGAGDAAMIGIVIHGLLIGSQLQGGWFRSVWWVYAITLMISIGHKYFLKITTNRKPAS